MSEDRETRPEVIKVEIQHPVLFGIWFALGAAVILPLVVFVSALVLGIVLAGFGGL